MPTNFISLEQAIRMTKTYQGMKDQVLASAYRSKNVLPVSETFGREAFDAVLAQGGCTGLRVYFGMDDQEQLRVLIVGVDGEGRDMLPEEMSATDNSNIIEDGVRCPDFCPEPSPLNS